MKPKGNIFFRLWKWQKGFWRSQSLLTFLLFLVLATIIWFGHAMNTVRERSIKIPIEYVGITDNIDFQTPLPTMLSVVVRDQGKRLRYYKESMLLPVQIDLTQQLKGEAGEVHFNTEQVRQKLTDQLQGTAKLQRIAPDIIESAYWKQAERTVPVVFAGIVQTAKQYQITMQPTPMPGKVKIYGQKAQLDTIKQITTENILLQDVKDSINTDVMLMLPEGIRTTTDKVHIVGYAQHYTEKRITIPVQTRGVPATYHLRTFPSQVEVVMHVSINQFQQINETMISAYCKYPEHKQNILPVELNYSSPHILSARVEPSEVEYVIEKY